MMEIDPPLCSTERGNSTAKKGLFVLVFYMMVVIPHHARNSATVHTHFIVKMNVAFAKWSYIIWFL